MLFAIPPNTLYSALPENFAKCYLSLYAFIHGFCNGKQPLKPTGIKKNPVAGYLRFLIRSVHNSGVIFPSFLLLPDFHHHRLACPEALLHVCGTVSEKRYCLLHRLFIAMYFLYHFMNHLSTEASCLSSVFSSHEPIKQGSFFITSDIRLNCPVT